jgi:hypothetical protein
MGGCLCRGLFGLPLISKIHSWHLIAMFRQHHHLSPASIPQAIQLLRHWLQPRLSVPAFEWLDTELRGLQTKPEQARWFKALGMAPRKLGKNDLHPTVAELQQAQALRQGLDPSEWSVDQTARIAFTMAFYQGEETSFVQQMGVLVDTSEINAVVGHLQRFCFVSASPGLRAQSA